MGEEDWRQECSELIRTAYGTDSSLKDGYSRIGYYLLDQDPEEAFDWFKKDQESDRATWYQTLQYAACLARLGKVSAALALVKATYAQFPEAVNGYATVGWCMRAELSPKRSLRYAKKDISLTRLTLGFSLNVATLAYRAKHRKHARNLVNNAYDQDPRLRDGFARLATVARQQGNLEEAFSLVARDEKLGRLTKDTKERWANIHSSLDDFERAYLYQKKADVSKRTLLIVGRFLGKDPLFAPKLNFFTRNLPHSPETFQNVLLFEHGDLRAIRSEFPETEQTERLFDCIWSLPSFLSFQNRSHGHLLTGLCVSAMMLVLAPSLLRVLLAAESARMQFCADPRTRTRWQILRDAIEGLGKIWHLFTRLGIGRGDVMLLFTGMAPVHRLLDWLGKRAGAHVMLTEYGELPGTLFVSEAGGYDSSWIATRSEEFNSLLLSATDRQNATAVIDRIREMRYSNKTHTRALDDSLKKQLSEKRVIFVPGLAPFGMGWMPRVGRRSFEYSPYFDSNDSVVKAVLDAVPSDECLVVYKEHPNTLYAYPGFALKNQRRGSLIMLPDVDIHDVLDYADVTVTLGSKVAFHSLIRNVPVVLLGPYSMRDRRLCTHASPSSLKDAIDKALVTPVDQRALTDYCARLMRYYLYQETEHNDLGYPRGDREMWTDILEFAQGNRSVVSHALQQPGQSREYEASRSDEPN